MHKHSFIPSNRLTFETVQSDSKRLLEYMRNSKTTYSRLDLREVIQCDSAGLALIIEAKRLCKQYNKNLEIEGMPLVVHALAKFCGVDAIVSEVND